MAKKKENTGYDWKYCSLGSVTRVNIETGEDIAHLGELDQKLWTVLSCPTKGLHIDGKTLEYMDTDGDGKIRVGEVVSAAQWLCTVLKDNDAILKGADTIALDGIDTSTGAGKKLLDSSKRILANLGKADAAEISLADASDTVAIFSKTQFNGDGVITESSTDDESLKALIKTCMDVEGSIEDRSGAPGINSEMVEKFYASCADWSAWQAAGKADPAILPYGENTAAALAACEALRSKISDFFIRCKLVKFNDACTGAVDVSAEKLGNISDLNLTDCGDQISQYPLAHPTGEAVLPFDSINPAWQEAFAKLKALVLDVDFPDATGIDEDQWNAVIAKFGPYSGWCAAEKGSEVAALGLEAVDAILKAGRKAELLEIIDKDVAVKEESDQIFEVGKLLHYYRDFAQLLRNYVVMKDFYDPNEDVKGIFEEGKLYIDQRCCRLCIKVADMGGHADMAALSGMFLIYCTCTSKTKGETMDIVAVMTDGPVKNLRPGTNAVFYDRDGLDWDAVVTKIVDNPLSIKQAFWSPYRKFANFISSKITKSAEDKDAAATAKLQAASADGAPKQPFDVSKFASMFAVIGIAVAAIGAAFAGIIAAVKGLAWWKWLVIIAAILLVISGPACFIAWRKLRKRNLGPVLNANGWAINSVVLVNIPFGSTLTSVAKYPHLKLDDPYAQKTPLWKKLLRGFIVLVVVAAVLFFTNCLKCIGLPFHKDKEAVEQVEQAPAEAEAPAAEVPAEVQAE